MNAMLFAAGLGTRLYPITKDRPKALAPFAGTTLLAYNLRQLAEQGITRFVINTHHFSGMIRNYLEQHQYFGLDVKISEEPILLDTAGGLEKAAPLFDFDDLPILLYNVDVVSDLNVANMLTVHHEQKASVTLAVRQRESSRFLLFDQNDLLSGWENQKTGVQRLVRPEASNWHRLAFSGIHLVETSVLRHLEAGRKYSLTDFYLEQMARIPIKAYLHDEDHWFDCGKIEDLRAAERFVMGK